MNPEDNQKDLRNAKKIREIYLESGYSYTQFAKVTGISYNTVACWLTGRRNPPDYVVDAVRMKIESNKARKRKKLQNKERDYGSKT